MKLILSVLSFSLLFTGCATMDYTAYQGQQRNWPTATGAFVKEVAGIPVYHGLPTKPYHVLGIINAVDAGDVALARRCRTLGGDAIIITDSRTFDGGTLHTAGSSYTYGGGYASGYMSGNRYNGSYSGSSYTVNTPGYSIPLTSVATTARVIKFRDPREVQREQYEMFLHWADAHPGGASVTNENEVLTYTGEQIAKRRAEIAAELEQLKSRPNGK